MGRLALQWFRAYFAASRNSGCAATIYSTISVLPAALVAVALFHSSGSNTNAFVERLITHLKLTGSTATLVENSFGSASSNKLAATVAVLISALLWGIGIGQIYQSVYARAWGIEVGSAADQALFAIFFFVFTGAIAFAVVAAGQLRDTGWYALVPAWLLASTAFWLWVPRFLLHRKIALRSLLPGALLATVVLGGATATAPLFLPPTDRRGREGVRIVRGLDRADRLVLRDDHDVARLRRVLARLGCLAEEREATRRRARSRPAERTLLLSRRLASPPHMHEPEQMKLPPPRRTLLRRLTLWAEHARALKGWIEQARRRSPALDATFDTIERDSDVGGNMLAGALSYRLFVFSLPAAYFAVAGLGLLASALGIQAHLISNSVGLSGIVTNQVANTAKAASNWWIALSSFFVLVYATRVLFRAIAIVHSLAWERSAASVKLRPRPFGICAAALAGQLLLVIGLSAVKHQTLIGGILTLVVFVLALAAAWLVVSLEMPHSTARWTDLIPGSLFYSVGFTGVMLFNVLILGSLIHSKTSTYGTLGTAATLLLAYFFIGRTIVGAAVLNAALFARRSRAARATDVAPRRWSQASVREAAEAALASTDQAAADGRRARGRFRVGAAAVHRLRRRLERAQAARPLGADRARPPRPGARADGGAHVPGVPAGPSLVRGSEAYLSSNLAGQLLPPPSASLVQYGYFRDEGFQAGAAEIAAFGSFVFPTLGRFLLPLVALAVLVATGDADGTILLAGALSLAITGAAVLAGWFFLRRESTARRLGARTQRPLSWILVKLSGARSTTARVARALCASGRWSSCARDGGWAPPASPRTCS